MRWTEFAQRPELLEMASDMLSVRFDPAQSTTVASMDEDRVLAVTVYTRFSPWNCEMSIASWSPAWCHRAYLDLAFGYPFRQIGLERVSVVCEESNEVSRRMVVRLGWRFETRLTRWFGKQDGILYRMLREECPWLRENRHETVAT